MLFAQMICRGERIVFLTQFLATFWQQLVHETRLFVASFAVEYSLTSSTFIISLAFRYRYCLLLHRHPLVCAFRAVR